MDAHSWDIGGATGGGVSHASTESPAMTNVDIISSLVQFVHGMQFLHFASVSRTWREAWGERATVTSWVTAHSSLFQLQHSFACGVPRNGIDWCAATARVGNLELLKWATKEGYPWNGSLSAAAAEGGHIEVLEWLRQEGCLLSEVTCAGAALGGNLETLEWCRANGCPWDSSTTRSAAKAGHLHILRYAREKGCPWNARACSAAAGAGRLETLEWCRANGCLWDGLTTESAAKGGHIHILRYAREKGCPWDARACSAAAGAGKLAALQWLRQAGCEWDLETSSKAAKHGHVDILRWAFTHGCPTDLTRVCTLGAQRGNVDIIKWGRENGGDCATNAVYWASVGGHVEALEYLKMAGCCWSAEGLLPAVKRAQEEAGCTADKRRRLERVVSWVRANASVKPAREEDISVEERRAAPLLEKQRSEAGGGSSG